MRENIEKGISLNDVAAYAGYSPSHFSSLFRQRTGESLVNYFNTLRLNRACELLRETNMKINQICYKVGIEDNYYFSRLFSQKMGVSPTEYRAQFCENNNKS
jgi:transcriptional regulator GlxA family with amidase domain